MRMLLLLVPSDWLEVGSSIREPTISFEVRL